MPAKTSPMLTTRQVASLLKVSTHTLARWRSEGYGPPSHLLGDRLIRYSLAGLEQWVISTQTLAPDQINSEGEALFSK